jgi:hypothetical protein
MFFNQFVMAIASKVRVIPPNRLLIVLNWGEYTDPVTYLQKTAKVKDECAKIYFKLRDSAAVEGQALNAEDDGFGGNKSRLHR